MGMANKSWRKNILRQVNVFYKKARTLASTKLLLNRKAYKSLLLLYRSLYII
jgi:hypothetical protein